MKPLTVTANCKGAMKRKAEEEGLAHRFKRPATAIETVTANLDDREILFVESDSESVSQDASPTTAPTPVTATATSVNSRRSRKFPSDIKSLECPFSDCQKTFNRPARLAAHLRSHNNERPFKCAFDGCDKSYIEEKHLKQHVKGSHTKEKKYHCEEDGCDASFTTGTRLRRHADVHAGSDRYRCKDYPGCNETFRKHQTLQRHIRTVHLGISAYPCEVKGCGAPHDSQGALRRHMERDHGEEKYFCDECADQAGGEASKLNGFTTEALLNAHLRLFHMACHFCDARPGTPAQLEQHIDEVHAGNRGGNAKNVVPCERDGCPKTFSKVANMRAHVKTAHEGFRYVCGTVDLSRSDGLQHWNEAEEGCGSGFTTKVKLEEHVRYVHLGQQRPKTGGSVVITGRSRDAMEDIVGFSAARQILCASLGCGATFIRHADLAVHMAMNHGGEPEDTEMMDAAPSSSFSNPGPSSSFSANSNQSSGPDGLFWLQADEPVAMAEDEFMGDLDEMRRLIDLDA